MKVYNGELYAGGTFTIAGDSSANKIARWNGTYWASVGSGMDNWINNFAVYNGELYAGGRFFTAGGIPSRGVARWTTPNGIVENSVMNNSVSVFPNPFID